MLPKPTLSHHHTSANDTYPLVVRLRIFGLRNGLVCQRRQRRFRGRPTETAVLLWHGLQQGMNRTKVKFCATWTNWQLQLQWSIVDFNRNYMKMYEHNMFSPNLSIETKKTRALPHVFVSVPSARWLRLRGSCPRWLASLALAKMAKIGGLLKPIRFYIIYVYFFMYKHVCIYLRI